MKFISILGKTEDFDYVIDNYISGEEIHIESTMVEKKDVSGLRLDDSVNPYTSLINKTEKIFGDIAYIETDMEVNKAEEILNNTLASIKNLAYEKQKYSENLLKLQEDKRILSPFQWLNFDLKPIIGLDFIHVRFGNMPKDVNVLGNVLKPYNQEQNSKVAKYYFYDYKMGETTPAVFVTSFWDKDFVWGVYISPSCIKEKVDEVFSSFHFKRRFVPDEVLDNPMERFKDIKKQISETEEKLKEIEEKLERIKTDQAETIGKAYFCIKNKSNLFDIRKYAAVSKNFFYIVGWMKKDNALSFQEKTTKDDKITFTIEEETNAFKTEPPTDLQNPGIFKPFEMYLKLYGVPEYKELDPTIFMTLSFITLFGAMFGDVGQGLLLAIFGFFMFKKKDSSLGGIISLCGLMAMVFGFLYGSVFGNEELLPALWINPSKNIMTILFAAVALGAVLEMSVLLLNIKSSIKKKEYTEAFLSHNGLAGLLFYSSAILTVLSMFTGGWMKTSVMIAIAIVTLSVIFFKEPIDRKIKGEKKIFEESLGIFVVQSFFELFEILLSYVTNTISFIRIGAFALSHAGMMGVVAILMTSAGKGTIGYYLIFVIGNLIVIGLEGLVVSIQVLRLEFYEMFGRFFSGGGREFVPYNKIY